MTRHATALFDRRAKEEREERYLAPWALKSAHSRGRRFREEEDDLRTSWERDRDRIVHATSFRRLMYKTQVFVNSEGDHYRTRLSHSLEVAQVARSVASALGLNEPFTECLALAHDLGHPPFGHRGERALDALMKTRGGFRHNRQVLRVVDRLERRSPDYPGLNLTHEVRESLLKHEQRGEWPAEFEPRASQPFLEAQVVDLADSTAYHAHDLEDGLNAGMFDEAALEVEVALWRGAREAVALRHPGFLEQSTDRKLRVKRIANELIKICINDLIEASARRLEEAAARFRASSASHATRTADAPAALDPESARRTRQRHVGHGAEIAAEIAELSGFLYARFYRHEHLKRFSARAKRMLSRLFEAYLERPDEMPRWYQDWCDEVGRPRAVCDYLAGMTDRFAEQEYARLA